MADSLLDLLTHRKAASGDNPYLPAYADPSNPEFALKAGNESKLGGMLGGMLGPVGEGAASMNPGVLRSLLSRLGLGKTTQVASEVAPEMAAAGKQFVLPKPSVEPSFTRMRQLYDKFGMQTHDAPDAAMMQELFNRR